MTRTRSVVRCRGIYRPRDTRVKFERERDSGDRRRGRAKRPRFIVGKFPSWRCFQKWWRTGQRRRRGSGVFLRAIHSGLRSFLIRRRREWIRKRGGHLYLGRFVLAAGSFCFRCVKDVAEDGTALFTRITESLLMRGWKIHEPSHSRDGGFALFSREICKMAFSRNVQDETYTLIFFKSTNIDAKWTWR